LLIGLLAVLLLGCSLSRRSSSRVTPTPSKTPKPTFTVTATPTQTPIPTDTPTPTATFTPTPLATSTPVIVTATSSPVPESTIPPDGEVPSPTAPPETVPPADTAPPPTDTAQAQPTDAPPPATNTPAPPTSTPAPLIDFKIKELYAFVDGSTAASGFHNIYFTVVDAGGTPLDDIILEELVNQPAAQEISGEKGPGKAEFEMLYGDYRFKVTGDTSGNAYASEETHVMSVVFGHAIWDDLIRGGVCPDVAACEALGQAHYSYDVTFQRTW
jgi:hypothetical protein